MKKIIMTLVLSISIIGVNFAQENQQGRSINLYTFFVNIVDEQFQFPLLGFINVAAGNHTLPQIGFVNWNQKDFNTLQFGFVNTVGGDMDGLQFGFVNTVVDDMDGMQFGFVNTIPGSFRGLQFGFVNTAVGESINGVQFGFVNTAKRLKGLQFGFINYTDTIEEGVPIGFLSIVKNGGYKAIEVGFSEISPFNLSFKIGVERFYTSFIVGYNPFKDGIREEIIWGAGFGSIIQLGKIFYLNPEITAYNRINEGFQQYVSIIPYFGYNIIPNLSIIIGPSVVWAYEDNDAGSPFFKTGEYSINEENKLYFGVRIALRYRW